MLLIIYSKVLQLFMPLKNCFQMDGDEIYSTIVQLRDQCSELQHQIEEQEQRGETYLLGEKRRELQATEQQLFAKTEERRKYVF